MADASTNVPGVDDIQPHALTSPAPAGPAGPAGLAPAAQPALEAQAPKSTPGPLAIISDIHSNLEALQAVLADIQGRGIKRIVCLGDVVGYGPNPLECMDLIMKRCEFSLMGNHDFAIFYEPANFNPAAENASFWTRSQFDGDPDVERRNTRWRFLGSMPTRMATDRFVCFHGSPRKPVNEYVFAADIYSAPAKMLAIFDRIQHLCFVGHTHVPGVFVPDPDFYAPEELDNRYKITEERAMINVGSVGQPRDRNPNASYVILTDETVEFMRVPYDVQTTVNKIKAIEALDNFLGIRLIDGR
jgi:diadenosine tetraphosphatase ApaH/serine/threonine PP2A family protein phosphatase